MADRIELAGLRIAAGDRTLVDGIGLALAAGECLALVGPSGAGKSLTSLSLLGLVDLDPGVVAADLSIAIDGQVLRPWDGVLGAGPRARDRAFAPVRGRVIGVLPQDARDALDPLRRVGWQVARAAPGADVLAALRRAGLDDVERVARAWPHELSGGMARRVTIAQALARHSRFLVVDEPTSGLDAVAVHELCQQLRALVDGGLGLLLITHDLRILPGLADRVLFVAEGRAIEALPSADLAAARSPMARSLLEATARIGGRA